MNLRSAYEQIVRRTKVGAPETLANDERAIRQFEQLVPRASVVDVSDIDNADLAEFRAAWIRQAGNPATGNKHLAKIRSILRYLAELGHLNCVPIFRKIPEDDPQPRAASESEISRMIDAASGARWPTVVPAADYWKAVILTGVNTGMARREILNLEWPDVDRERMMVEFARQKTRKGQGVPITSKTLDAWERIRIPGARRVFYSTRSNSQFYREWHALQDRAGITDHYGTHDLRRTCCNRVYASRGLFAAAEVMGHSTTSVTVKHYLTRAKRAEHLRSAVESAEYGREAENLDDECRFLLECYRKMSDEDRRFALHAISKFSRQ